MSFVCLSKLELNLFEALRESALQAVSVQA